MADLRTLPIVSLAMIRFARMVHLKSNGDVEFADERPCLIWDPAEVRAILDERIYRNPIVALVVPVAGKDAR